MRAETFGLTWPATSTSARAPGPVVPVNVVSANVAPVGSLVTVLIAPPVEPRPNANADGPL